MTIDGGSPIEEDIISDIISEYDSLEEEEDNSAAETAKAELLLRAEVMGNLVDDILKHIDLDEVEDFEWVQFNRLALKSIAARVHRQVPEFMKLAKITDANELSLFNPPYEKKIKYYSKDYSWWRFITDIMRDLFPEFTFKKYGVNKINFGNFIVKEVIIPIALLKNGQIPQLDSKRIEDEFNDLLLKQLIRKIVYKKQEL